MSITNKLTYYVSSKHRSSGSTSDFYYNIDIPLDVYTQINKVSVTNINIPKSYYAIASGYNTFELVENNIHKTITVTPCNYSKSQLYIELSKQMTLGSMNGIEYECSDQYIDKSSGKMKITAKNNTNNYQIEIHFDNINDMYDTMGFNKNSVNVFVNNELISTNIINLNQKSTSIYLMSNAAINKYTNNNTKDNGCASVIATIYGQAYVVYSWINNTFDIISNMNDFNQGINSLFHFYISDDDNNEINLNGIDISFCINFFTYTAHEPLYKKVSYYLEYKS